MATYFLSKKLSMIVPTIGMALCFVKVYIRNCWTHALAHSPHRAAHLWHGLGALPEVAGVGEGERAVEGAGVGLSGDHEHGEQHGVASDHVTQRVQLARQGVAVRCTGLQVEGLFKV